MKIEIINQRLYIKEPPETAEGTRKYLRVEFSFSEEWDEMTKTAFFCGANGDTVPRLLEEDTCTVPAEVLAASGWVGVSVSGTLGETIITTDIESFFVPATLNGGTPSDPEPTLWQEVLDKLEKVSEVEKKVTELNERCDTIPTRVSQLENDSKYLPADGAISWGRKEGTDKGDRSVALGKDAEASGVYSFAEGELTKATGRGSHAEGGAGTIASGKYAHGEGYGTTASGQSAHSEGYNTYATGSYSHASGYNSKATAGMATAQNYGTEANGQCSHAEGFATVANQTAAHAEGGGTIASSKYQHVQGRYNIEDTENKYAHIVGGGTDANNRRNIHTVDWDGNAEYAGDVTVNYGGNQIQVGVILKSLLDNPYMHRNIFRGKSLGESITAEQLEVIRDGSFADLYVGDYWKKDGVRYRIADINYWRNVGYPESEKVQKPHILIVPDTALGSGQMNANNSTAGGYRNSAMKTVRLNQIANSLPDAFKNILISHRIFSDGTWITASIDLMNEVMVHGTYICTDNNNKQTSDAQQLSLFRLCPELKSIGQNYWLRNVSGSQTYTLMSQYGDASTDAATSTYGIRPVFAVG